MQIISTFGLCVNEAKEELYILLELMDCDLQYLINTGQTLTETHLKCFLKQMLEGLKAMHSLKILRTLCVCAHTCFAWSLAHGRFGISPCVLCVLWSACFVYRPRFEASKYFGVKRCAISISRMLYRVRLCAEPHTCPRRFS